MLSDFCKGGEYFLIVVSCAINLKKSCTSLSLYLNPKHRAVLSAGALGNKCVRDVARSSVHCCKPLGHHRNRNTVHKILGVFPFLCCCSCLVLVLFLRICLAHSCTCAGPMPHSGIFTEKFLLLRKY